MVILYCLITNFTCTKGAKYSHPVLMTHLCRNFLPDKVFSSYDRVFVAPERITSADNSCLHIVWTPSVQPEDVSAESSSEELLEEDDEPAFWQQPPPTDSRAFMSFIWKGMKKNFKGQISLRKQMEEHTTCLDRIEESLRRSRLAGPSTSAGPSRRKGLYFLLPYLMHMFYLHTLGTMHEIGMGGGY